MNTVNTVNESSILVILAHPDDESFPMGGTLAKYAAQGVKVVLICATQGEAGIPGVSPDRAGEIRAAELQCAGEKLGLSEIQFLGYQDGTLSQVDPEELTLNLANLMHEYQPQVVITFGPEGISGHPDHKAISRYTTEAFDRSALPNARLFYLAPSEATSQGCGVEPLQEFSGGPVASVDITPFLEAKVRAIQCHASQNPPLQGNPEDEVDKMACHEVFVLARPAGQKSNPVDLFVKPASE